MAAMAAALDIGLAYIMSICVDVAMGNRDGSLLFYGCMFLAYIGVFFCIYFLFRKLMFLIQKTAKIHIREKVTEDIYRRLEGNTMNSNSGELISLLTTDINTMNDSYINIICTAIPDIIVFAASTILMIYISPVLFAWIGVISVLQMMIPGKFGGVLSMRQKDFSEASEKYTTVLSEHLQAFDTMRNFGRIRTSKSILSQKGERLETARCSLMTSRAFVQMMAVTLGNFSYIGLFFVGAILILHHKMTVGELVGASQLAVYITGPMQTIAESFADIKGAKEIVQKLLPENKNEKNKNEKIKNADEAEKAQISKTDIDKIIVNDITFGYSDKCLFDHAGFTFEKGKNYLIQAPSGTGKSTLGALLSGVLEPASGKILYDDIPVKNIPIENRIGLFAVCPQHPFIFQDSLKNNITLFDNRYSDETVLKVLDTVNLHMTPEAIDGINSKINQAGKNMSGGELQRLALARLMLLDTKFIFLDEGMANLDVNATALLLTKLTKKEDQSLIYISHQENDKISQLFDCIVTIKNGKIELL
jgi:ATP-binding cassette subfamily B protein